MYEYDSSMIDEILFEDEDVEWAVHNDVSDSKYLLLLSLAFTVFVVALASLSTLPSLEFLPLQVFGLFIFVISIYFYIKEGRSESWYFLTSKRLLETKGERIVQEIDRTRLGDTPLPELVSMRAFVFEGESGYTKHYEIIVHDLDTLEPIFLMNRLWFKDVEDKSPFQDMQGCTSCGVQVSKNLEKCLTCGQSLV